MYVHKDVPGLIAHDTKCPGYVTIPRRYGKTIAEYCGKCGKLVATWDLKKKPRRNRFELPPNWQEEE